MQCAESLRVQAFFDGELDALAALEVERHAAACAACGTLLEELGQVRRLMRGAGLVRAPEQLRQQILRGLDQESAAHPARRRGQGLPLWKRSTFWIGALSGAGGGAVAAALVVLIMTAQPARPLLDDLVADHTRSLLGSHLIDVVSTDRHTVKPWFAGRTDVSPVVADFAQQGYRLLGGRADYLDHQRSAVVVYQHGAHFINVFSWSLRSGRVPPDTNRNGYHLAFWKAGNVGYCAVSDAGWSELQGLARLLQDAGARDQPE